MQPITNSSNGCTTSNRIDLGGSSNIGTFKDLPKVLEKEKAISNR